MKKLMSGLLLCSLMSTMPGATVIAGEITKEVRVKKIEKENLDLIFKEFKKTVQIDGIGFEIALSDLVDKVIENKYAISDVQLYLAQNSSKEEFNKFNELLDLTLEDTGALSELSQEELSFLLSNTFSKTSTTGSNFMSCAAGMGIGVPLIAVGLILGITALVNATASKEIVTKEYIQKRKDLAKEYLNTIADLEFEITTYESDKIYYRDEIVELQRRIDSGNYSSNEIEEMNQLIRDYEFLITDADALIGEVNVDINYFVSKHDSDVTLLDDEEISSLLRVDEKRSNAGKQALVAGIAGGVGAFFAGFSASDCN